MNNKGQSLAVFVLIIPIIILLFILVLDYGMISVEKRKISSSVKSSIKYGLKKIDNENIQDDLKKLIYKNINQDSIKKLEIQINNDSISVDIVVKYDGVFNFITNNIKVFYTGSIVDNKIKIIKR